MLNKPYMRLFRLPVTALTAALVRCYIGISIVYSRGSQTVGRDQEVGRGPDESGSRDQWQKKSKNRQKSKSLVPRTKGSFKK